MISLVHRLPGLTVRVLIFTGLVSVLLIAVLFPVLPSSLQVSVGDIAAQTVRAPQSITYNSEVIRAQLQEQALRAVREVVTYNASIKNEQLARLTDVANRAGSLRETPGMLRSAREDGLSRVPGLNLSAAQRTALLDLTPEGWRIVVDEAARVLGTILEEPFSLAEMEDRQASVPARVSTGLTAAQGDLVVALVKPLVSPTQRLDENETRRAREKAAASIGPQTITYARNQVIVREGEPIDEAKLEALKNAGLLELRVRPADLVAVVLVSLLAALSLGLTLLVLRPPSVLASLRRLLLVAALIAGMVLIGKLFLPLVIPDTGRRFYAYGLPVALVPLLVAALFEAPFAILVAAVLALLTTFTAVYLPDLYGIVGLSTSQPLGMAAAYFFSGLAGVLAVGRAERLNRFFLAGAAIAAATFLSLTAFWSIEDARTSRDLLWIAGNSAAAGLLAALLAIGLATLLGSLFDVTTRLQLMELAQMNAPLLRRLQEEAPGSFHHSIIVGNLAERAADKIGADSLLVRVGAYYHDIGKMGRPAFYIENQLGGENPHDRLEPHQSADLIQEHVRHGVELARRYHLPERVRAFIPEHHGSRLVTYFYRTAALKDPNVDPAAFRYPGPAPQSRETALVMLADSSEAIVRASADRSPEAINRLVESVISERVTEGQFDACDLTLKDLRIVAESFKSSLRAIYHPRIEYPAAPSLPAVSPNPPGRIDQRNVETERVASTAESGGLALTPTPRPILGEGEPDTGTVPLTRYNGTG